MLFQYFDCNWTCQILLFYILPSHHLIWEISQASKPWKCTYYAEELTFAAVKLSAKVSLMLENPFQFQFPSLCKLNHISVFLSWLAKKSHANCRFPSEKAMFILKMIPDVLDHSLNFNITEISIKTVRVSRLSPFLVTMEWRR